MQYMEKVITRQDGIAHLAYVKTLDNLAGFTTLATICKEQIMDLATTEEAVSCDRCKALETT